MYKLKNIREGECYLRFSNGRRILKPVNGMEIDNLTEEEVARMKKLGILSTTTPKKKVGEKKDDEISGE